MPPPPRVGHLHPYLSASLAAGYRTWAQDMLQWRRKRTCKHGAIRGGADGSNTPAGVRRTTSILHWHAVPAREQNVGGWGELRSGTVPICFPAQLPWCTPVLQTCPVPVQVTSLALVPSSGRQMGPAPQQCVLNTRYMAYLGIYVFCGGAGASVVDSRAPLRRLPGVPTPGCVRVHCAACPRRAVEPLGGEELVTEPAPRPQIQCGNVPPVKTFKGRPV